jgi:hypothetical protein
VNDRTIPPAWHQGSWRAARSAGPRAACGQRDFLPRWRRRLVRLGSTPLDWDDLLPVSVTIRKGPRAERLLDSSKPWLKTI